MDTTHETPPKPSANLVGWGLGLLPVGGIMTLAALILRDPGDPVGWVVLGVLVAAVGWVSLLVGAARMAQRVDDLWERSRVDASGPTAAPRP